MKEKFKWDVKMYIVLSEKKMFKISMETWSFQFSLNSQIKSTSKFNFKNSSSS